MNDNKTTNETALRSLRGRIARLRATLRTAYLGYGTVRLLQFLAAGVILTFLMDWFLDLPRWVRAFHASLALIVGVLTIHRFVIFPLVQKLGDEELAILLEKSNPGLRDRMISALQLARQAKSPEFTDSPALVTAMVEETDRTLSSLKFAPILDKKRLFRASLLAIVGLGTLLGFARFYPTVADIYVRRNIALRDVPWPQKTFLEVMLPQEGENIQITNSGSLTKIRIARGTDLKINVKANGKVPANVELWYESEDRSLNDRRVMNRIGDRDFTYQFLALTQSFYFHVEGGDDDDRDPLFWVDVQPTPRVKKIEVDLTPPVYTRQDPRTLTQGNFEAPEGSLLKFRIETSMEVDEALISLGEGSLQPLTREDARTFVFPHVLTESTSYTFVLEGANGLKNRDPLRYSLTAVPDTDPRIHLSLPGVADLDATPRAVVPVKITVTDDYGVDRAWLTMRLGRELPEHILPFADADLTRVPRPGSGEEIIAFQLLDFSQLVLPLDEAGDERTVEVGDRIRYLAVAQDHHTSLDGESTPNFGSTTESRVSVVTRIELERKLEELRRRLREDVRKLQKKQVTAQEKVLTLTTSLDDGSAAAGDATNLDPAEKEAILDAEVAENRLLTDSRQLSTDLARIFDVHLFNRLEEGSLTEKVIATLFDSFRNPSDDPLAGYRRVIGDHASGALGDSDQIGKMIEMLGILFRVSFERIPDAGQMLKQARSTVEREPRRALLDQAVVAQGQVVEDLELLLTKMEEWEDFQSIVQMTRDLIESQEGVRNRTRNEIQDRERKR